MERLFYALQLLSLGDRKFIGQLAKYSRMDYVRKCVNIDLKWHPVHYRINGWMNNSRHGLRLYQHVFCLIQLSKMHSLTRLAHLYLTLRNWCMLQR